jgi:hypothetical protein
MIPISYKSEGVGRLLSSTKIRHIWNFKINNKDHKVEFFESKMSGNFQVILDGQATLYKGNHQGKEKNFVFDFDVNGVNLQIRTNGTGFEIYSNGKSFHYLLMNPTISPVTPPSRANDATFQALLETGLKRKLTDGVLMNRGMSLNSAGSPVSVQSPAQMQATNDFLYGGIPTGTPLIDPNLLINNTARVSGYPALKPIKIQGRCQLESRGDYFMEIDFPIGEARKAAIYTEVHREF